MTTWLIRIRPDLRDATTRRELGDAVRLHHRLMHLVPDGLGENARHKAGLLYRIDETREGVQILVQTGIEPKPDTFNGTLGRVDIRDITPLLDRLQQGTPVRYRLAANASKRLARNAGPREGEIQPLGGADAEQWWAQRAAGHGLALQTLHAHSQDAARGIRKDQHRVRHAVTRFDGTAIITDPDLVRTAVMDGVGRGKSYGCGLLSLAPIQRAP